MSIIKLENLCLSYKGKTPLSVLENVNAEIKEGEFIAVQGSSGCGKSTLLLALGGLLSPESGKVIVNEKSVYSLSSEERALFRAKNIGFVFQQFHLIPYLNVLENILAPSLAWKTKDTDIRAEILMKKFGLTDRKNHTPPNLSTGERQRVGLARALLLNPKIILADEATGNLDPENTELVLETLKEFSNNGGSVVLVTHEDAVAAKADRIIVIKDKKIQE